MPVAIHLILSITPVSWMGELRWNFPKFVRFDWDCVVRPKGFLRHFQNDMKLCSEARQQKATMEAVQNTKDERGHDAAVENPLRC